MKDAEASPHRRLIDLRDPGHSIARPSHCTPNLTCYRRFWTRCPRRPASRGNCPEQGTDRTSLFPSVRCEVEMILDCSTARLQLSGLPNFGHRGSHNLAQHMLDRDREQQFVPYATTSPWANSPPNSSVVFRRHHSFHQPKLPHVARASLWLPTPAAQLRRKADGVRAYTNARSESRTSGTSSVDFLIARTAHMRSGSSEQYIFVWH
ncbi:hypothetical protein PsYK624_145590 [Phanerochaete sordida]|uniref:Uncharacterized protein n=1 Tax=Phanerochaete sordida TaxID=48140 RepID=A0A9P3GNN5_9APHY|nr:hypothetical protein PsYK624_145590 [Phanerochaete sordida]